MNFFPASIRFSIYSKPIEKFTTPIVKSQNILCMPVASVKTPATYDVDELPNFIAPIFTNRNPRNLEKLTIAEKPWGWKLDKPGRNCWHRLHVKQTSRYVTSEVVHNTGRVIISASTAEWPLRKRLVSYQDQLAYKILGQVLAFRCLESGIDSVMCTLEATPGGKLESFLNAVTSEGVFLTELEQYVDPSVTSKFRFDKPGEPEE